MTDTTEPPSIVTVALMPSGDLGIRVNPGPILEHFGLDPANLAPVIAAIMEQLCRATAEALVDDDGKHASVDDVRKRLLETLPGAVEHYSSDSPTFLAGGGDPD